MQIEFDPAKSATNLRERGLDFAAVKHFDFDTAIAEPDTRRDYGEPRVVAIGYLGDRLHVLCFKPVAYAHIRVISLRKANARERKIYAQAT